MTALSNHCLEPPLAPGAKDAPLSTDLSSGRGLPAPKILAIARKAMRDAILSEGLAGQLGDEVVGLQSGVTIDLSRSAIPELPEELVDIFKDKLERANKIREFPLPLCHLKRLEILDLGQNQLRVLPPEVENLSSLKVLSIPKNQIRELPLCLANMASLQVLKIKGNPIIFPPQDLISTLATTSLEEDSSVGSDTTEVAMTARIKSILKQEAINSRVEPDISNDSSHSTAPVDETPRPRRKRAVSGRFPIKVSGSEVSGMRYQRMGLGFHPMPSKLHCREQSHPYRSARRTVAPSATGNAEERLRSKSETLSCLGHQDRWNRYAELKETGECNLYNREPSYDCTTQGARTGHKSATTSSESILQQSIYARRLSVIPKRRRISKCFNPIIAFARGMLYAVLQIHPMIQQLAILARGELDSQPSLQIVIYSTNCHIEVLELEIQKYDTTAPETEDHSTQTNIVLRACQTLMGAYRHICTLLADSADAPVDNGHARYVRTILTLLYNCIMELRATTLSVTTECADCASEHAAHRQDGSGAGAGAGADARDKPAAPQSRNEDMMPKSSHPPSSRGPTPMSPRPEPGHLQPPDLTLAMSDPDGLFEKILVCLQNSATMMLRILPAFGGHLTHGLRNAVRRRAPTSHIQHWRCLTKECANAIQHTQTVKREICCVKLRGRADRPTAEFWDLVIGFIASWTALVAEIMACINKILLPPDTRARLRPIQESMKETSHAVVRSPWCDVLAAGGLKAAALPGLAASAPRGVSAEMAGRAAGEGGFVTVAVRGNGFDRGDGPGHGSAGVSLSRGDAVRQLSFASRPCVSAALETTAFKSG
ncbi:RAM signaling pathway, SOG2 [Metarhizium robertsii ARSEF 23]|uniref:RAM signaling pathway, SOG2 n=1 Tax=Metarhizium robertsii (strain ARSEF 23 / ATCC MYA-3075) TaxID=655844 RepID=E9F781_METRA|nr:RAM signaling pathway, SOG2 [Metarhizium robertsii ARSEF 23]EFY96411.1 RAM signaling pathway, SOG2 [Metarhizium robertsii ARSEF 23]